MVDWLALVIGNTRWHWAWFQEDTLKQVWHTSYLTNQSPLGITLRSIWAGQAPPQSLHLPVESTEIWAISVVPNQTRCLDHLTTLRWIERFPLRNVYSTMGLDRVATLWGASQHYGWPVLVIDAGTALTFTAGNDGAFAGGSILLGVRAHLAALHNSTAALPMIEPPVDLPIRWADNTASAIQSGVIHTMLASIQQFICSWQQRYPAAKILFTGGDGQYLYRLYQQQTQQNQVPINRTRFDPHLMFWGISAYRSEATRAL